MKMLLIALLALGPMAAKAASLEESYLASRDAYLKKFDQGDKPVDDADRLFKEWEPALSDLEGQLRQVVGPVELKGFSAPGKINLESLSQGFLGFGLLDGLLFSSKDGKTHIVVTTDGLIHHWLKEHKDWWGPKVANAPQEVDAALKSEAFYTQALQGDAAISQYAELPIAKPAKAKFAFAMLVARAQDIGPRTPDEIIAAVAQGGRVFIVSAPASAKIDQIAACQKIWREAEKKASQAQEAYMASEPKDDKLFERHTRLEEEGDAALRRCFAQRAKGQAFLSALTKQAQALLGHLPSR